VWPLTRDHLRGVAVKRAAPTALFGFGQLAERFDRRWQILWLDFHGTFPRRLAFPTTAVAGFGFRPVVGIHPIYRLILLKRQRIPNASAADFQEAFGCSRGFIPSVRPTRHRKHAIVPFDSLLTFLLLLFCSYFSALTFLLDLKIPMMRQARTRTCDRRRAVDDHDVNRITIVGLRGCHKPQS
jgi:hypothetical protein